jgi:flagellar motor switch protein FliN
VEPQGRTHKEDTNEATLGEFESASFPADTSAPIESNASAMNSEEAQQPEVEAAAMPAAETAEMAGAMNALKPFLSVPLKVTIELGRSRLSIAELLELGYHSVFALNKTAGNNLDIFANNVLIGRGEVVVIEDRVAVKLNEIVDNHD